MSLWSLHVSKHVEKKPKGQYREFLTLRQLSETPDLEKKCQISYKKKVILTPWYLDVLYDLELNKLHFFG